MEEKTDWKTWLLPLLTEDMRLALDPLSLKEVTEIRLRLGKPMEVVTAAGSRLLYSPNGRPMLRQGGQEQLLSAFSNHAPYAWEREMRQGFITLNSGCRMGITGRVTAETGGSRRGDGFLHPHPAARGGLRRGGVAFTPFKGTAAFDAAVLRPGRRKDHTAQRSGASRVQRLGWGVAPQGGRGGRAL